MGGRKIQHNVSNIFKHRVANQTVSFFAKSRNDCVTKLYNDYGIQYDKNLKTWVSNNPVLAVAIAFNKNRKAKNWECRVYSYMKSMLEFSNVEIKQYPRHFHFVSDNDKFYTIAFKYFSTADDLELKAREYVFDDLKPMTLEQATNMASKQTKLADNQMYRICVPYLLK